MSFVEYVQVLLAVAVAERQWLLYETSSIVVQLDFGSKEYYFELEPHHDRWV